MSCSEPADKQLHATIKVEVSVVVKVVKRMTSSNVALA
jgi:hypothetical protein